MILIRKTGIYLCLNIILITFFFPANAQIYNYTNYKVENGFPQSNADCIFQDNEGFMWFATQIGIVKFDGFAYEIIDTENGLSNNIVHHIIQDDSDVFWISTKGGLCKIKDNQFTSFTKKDGLYSDIIYNTCPVKDGKLLVCTEKGAHLIKNDKPVKLDSTIVVIKFMERKDGTILAISKSKLYQFVNNQFNELKEINQSIGGALYDMSEDAGMSLWIASNNGIYKINDKKITHFKESDGLLSNSINDLLIDSENNLWYSSEQKGCGKLQNGEFINFTVDKGLANSSVLTLFEDSEQNIWIGGRNGVTMFNTKIPFVHYNQISPFEDEIIMGMTRDNQNNIWFCTYGFGIFKYDGKEFINFNKETGSIDNHFFDVEQDKNGNLWFAGTSHGIIKYNGKTFSKVNLNGINIQKRVLTIFNDSKNNLWFGTNGSGLIKYNGVKFELFEKKFGIEIKNVFSINEDNDNNIWIGTGGEGLFQFTGKETVNFEKKYGIKSSIIRSIVNENGTMWFGTASNGIFKLIKEKNTYKQVFITKQQGLQSNNIYVLHPDKKGNLWVGSEKGVDKIKLHNHNPIGIVNYGKDDGFTGVETNLNASLEDEEGNMWFGTINGALKYNEKNDKINTIENKLYIADISLFHEPFDKRKYSDSLDSKELPYNLKLPHNKNHLTFHFIGLCYSNPGKVKYRYRLIGHNNEWSPPSSDRKAVFSNIEPGNYEFQVISANNNGIWNKKPVVYKFNIIQAFWQKIWFKIIIIIILLIIIYLFFEIRNKSLKIAKQNLEKSVGERTFELNEQKNKLETSNNKITEGISYARIIQSAMLPEDELFNLNFTDYFILNLPKDIVSGDFYWARNFVHKDENHIVISVADCTGHGIPGALVSMLGMALLNEITRKKDITRASQVLEELRNEIKKSLNQRSELVDQTEGIDMVLCDINTTNGEMQFAGANNPLYLIRDNELLVLKPTINPVGIFIKELPFENQIVQLKSNDILYMFTDGLIDQFNEKGEKFKEKRFRDMLRSFKGIKLSEQKNILQNTFLNWKGNKSQIDDVLVIAVKIK